MITSIEDALYATDTVITVALTHEFDEGQEVLVLVQRNYPVTRGIGMSFLATGVTESNIARWTPC
jgi:hypothetical protein